MTKDLLVILYMVVDDRLGSGLSLVSLTATVFGNVFRKYSKQTSKSQHSHVVYYGLIIINIV